MFSLKNLRLVNINKLFISVVFITFRH